MRLRRLRFVREQFFLAAVAQNIKRLVRFLSQPHLPSPIAANENSEQKTISEPNIGIFWEFYRGVPQQQKAQEAPITLI